MSAFFSVAILCLAIAVSAVAAGPPHFEETLKEESEHSTRAHIAVEVFTGEEVMSWCSEYALAENGKQPPDNSASWVLSACGTTELNVLGNLPFQEVLYLGTDTGPYPHGGAVIRHLTPSTMYFAKFHAINASGEATSMAFPFTTAAATTPEIARNQFGTPTFKADATSPHSAGASAQIETNGAQTEYEFDYAPAEEGHPPAEGSPSWTPFTTGATGTITVAEDFAIPSASVTGLAPETPYYARVSAKNAEGQPVHEIVAFTTPTAKPVVSALEARNVTGTSAHLRGDILPHGAETTWRMEYTTSEGGPWTPVPGAEGTITQAQAEALGEGAGFGVEHTLTGLSASTAYYVRLFAENGEGEGLNAFGEAIATEKQGLTTFTTFGAPIATTLAVHALHGEALRLLGSVNPNSVLTSEEQTIAIEGGPTGGTFTLTFQAQTTSPIAFGAPAEGAGGVGQALKALSSIGGDVFVSGQAGGPYTVYFLGAHGEVDQPAITADASALTPSSSVTVTTDQDGGAGYDAHYHFEYVEQTEFEKQGGEGGFAKALSTPEEDAGVRDRPEYVGADLPTLTEGESYRFRIVARSTAPGNPVIYGGTEALTAPTAPATTGEASDHCPNDVVRTGHSAHLPDCRAYEQLTPIDKGGAQEIFNYGGNVGNEGALPSPSGERLEYASSTVKWGSGPAAGQSPYFFSRADRGWQMTAATAQPAAGVFRYTPQLFSTDLGAFAFEASWHTSPTNPSPHTEFEIGAAGGPYSVAASVPFAQSTPGWVASSGDFSTFVLAVADRTLLGHSTHTQEGADLYEYANARLSQLNVAGPPPGATVGTCGATIARSIEGVAVTTSSHSVSEDGSRAFFEAVPGKACSEAKHLYMRVDHESTVNLGAYRFVTADPGGDRVLMDKTSGEGRGLYIYDTATAKAELLQGSEAVVPRSDEFVGSTYTVSEDFSAVYIFVRKNEDASLYRYDIVARTLAFVAQLLLGGQHEYHVASADGRYFYFIAREVGGLPAGGLPLDTPHSTEEKGVPTAQVFRYDADEAVVQCMSCASSFNPEPKLSALFAHESREAAASSDGAYVFFDTPAALVSQDVDGEVGPELAKSSGGEHSSSFYSVTSDVYEWRRAGIDGCSHPQGCLALITSGNGGFLNILLGTSSSGHDVFFATFESLLQSDEDTAGDIYDARVDGGFAVVPRPVECEGDACSTPFAAPTDTTPSSATFHGVGNQHTAAPKQTTKPKPKSKLRCKRKPHRKCRAKAKKRKAGKAKRLKRHVRSNGGAGR